MRNARCAGQSHLTRIVSERKGAKVVSGFSRRDVASTGSIALHAPRLSAKRASHLRPAICQLKSRTTFAHLEIGIALVETPSKKPETGAHCMEMSIRKLETAPYWLETRIKLVETNYHCLETRTGLLETHSRCLEMTTLHPETGVSHPETPLQQRKIATFKPENQPTKNHT